MSVEPASGRDLPKWLVVGVLWIWIGLLTITHWGARSPYSYGWAMFDGRAALLNGAVVNPDARYMQTVGMFFYEAAPPAWHNAQNLKLPLHAFATAIVAGYTGSYLLSSYLVNVFFAWLLAMVAVTAADRFGIRRAVTLVSLLTAFSLPIFVEYLGQPMHYIAGPAVSFLVILAMMVMDEGDVRNPWIAALSTAILTLNYDPYVFLAALVVWVLFVNRFARAGHYVVYGIAAALPNVLWSQYIQFMSAGKMTRHLYDAFVVPVLNGWKGFLLHPIDRILLPFIASHIGVHVAWHQIVILIPWPLLAVSAFLLVRYRPAIGKRMLLVALLPLFFVLEQMVAAAWDWELNPRRAIPVVFAFAVAYCWAAGRAWAHRGWRVAFVALLAFSAVLAMADTIFRSPVLAYIHTGQAVKASPQDALKFEKLRLDRNSMPALMDNEKPVIWRDLGTARMPAGGNRRTHFVVSQLFAAALLAGLLWLVTRVRLLPRWAPIVAVGVWAGSIVARFL
jgi:hypothetical protein